MFKDVFLKTIFLTFLDALIPELSASEWSTEMRVSLISMREGLKFRFMIPCPLGEMFDFLTELKY